MELDAATLKHSSLILLALQNFAYGLLLPISRRADKDGNVFFGPTAVVATELVKIFIALIGVASEGPVKKQQISTHRRTESKLREGQIQLESLQQEQNNAATRMPSSIFGPIQSTFTNILDRMRQGSSVKLLVPAILFVFQNNLQIQSASYLDATEFQVLSQLKLVTAAVCSVFILKRHLNLKHWTSIILLMIGICIVQQASSASTTTTTTILTKRGFETITQVHPQAFLIGSIAMLGACCFSGIASITMEYLLKNEVGFWSSNLLLASYSILPAAMPLIADVFDKGQFDIFRHFTLSVWATIFLNAIGGLLVSMVMKYADNILKGFAVAASLIATVLFQSQSSFSWTRIGGALMVVCSMIGYSQASSPPSSASSSSSPILASPVMSSKEELPLYDSRMETLREED